MRTSFYILFLLVTLTIIFTSILPVWWQNQRLQVKIEKLQQQINAMRRQRQKYLQEIKALQHDPFYVEFMLRQRLHYGRKGEKRW